MNICSIYMNSIYEYIPYISTQIEGIYTCMLFIYYSKQVYVQYAHTLERSERTVSVYMNICSIYMNSIYESIQRSIYQYKLRKCTCAYCLYVIRNKCMYRLYIHSKEVNVQFTAYMNICSRYMNSIHDYIQ